MDDPTVAMIRELAARNAKAAIAGPVDPDRTLTLPWPETMVQPGEHAWVQVMPSLLFRQEWMVVTAYLVRFSPEEAADIAAKEHEQTIAYYRDLLARRASRREASGEGGSHEPFQSILDHLIKRGPKVDVTHATSRARHDTVEALREITLESMHVGLMRLTPERPPHGVRLAPPSATPAEEERAFEQHLLETSCLRQLFPCRAAQLFGDAPRLGESINPLVLRELFATDTNSVVEPGLTIALRIHNTGRFPALFRAATFGRAAL